MGNCCRQPGGSLAALLPWVLLRVNIWELEVYFSFDNFNLVADARYQGKLPVFPEQRPLPEQLVGDDRAVSSLACYLVRSYASQITSSRKDDVCRIQLYFEA